MLTIHELLPGGDKTVNQGKGHVWIEVEFLTEKVEIRLDENSDTLHFRRGDDIGQTLYVKG